MGRVGRQEQERGTGRADRLVDGDPFGAADVVMMTMSPGLSVGTGNCSTRTVKLWPLIGRRGRRERRSGHDEARPGTSRTPFAERGALPRIGVMLVFAQISADEDETARIKPAPDASSTARDDA